MYCKTCKSFRFVDLSFKDLSRFITGGGGGGGGGWFGGCFKGNFLSPPLYSVFND